MTADSPSILRAQVLQLRKALQQLSGAVASLYTNKAIAAHRVAHDAYVASFSTEERAMVVALAQTRDAGISTFDDALTAYGTSLIAELRASGRME